MFGKTEKLSPIRPPPPRGAVPGSVAPVCRSPGICGPDIDPDLVNFAAMLSQLAGRGIKVERYNLSQQPMAFVQNPAVKALLDTDGIAVLPVMFWDGEVHLKGRYPGKEERPAWFQAAFDPPVIT